MDHYSKRDIILIIAGILLAGGLNAWLTVVGVQHYLDKTHASDPLAKAGA